MWRVREALPDESDGADRLKLVRRGSWSVAEQQETGQRHYFVNAKGVPTSVMAVCGHLSLDVISKVALNPILSGSPLRINLPTGTWQREI